MEDQNNSRKRARDDTDNSSVDSAPEVKRLRDDLLDFLDDSDPDLQAHDLDSVMKSFAEEISPASSSPIQVVDLTSESGESQTDLGYLLEASDDELGLPPSNPWTSREEEKTEEEAELVGVSSDESVIGAFWEIEERLPSYESFELEASHNYDMSSTEYVAFDGLFEYADVYINSADYSVYS